MKYFSLAGKIILLYGAGTKAKKYYTTLKEQNIPVIGFIDKRGSEIKYHNGLPVFSLEKLKEYANSEDIVIMVDVKNVFEHDEIAMSLMELGFFQLLFRPGRVLRGNANDQEKQLNYIYDQILNGMADFEEKIPILDEIRLPVIEDAALIREENDIVIAKIPVPLVYTSNRVINPEGWTDSNVSTCYPHIYLFKKMLGIGENSSDYIKMCASFALQKDVAVTEAWKENVIRNRIDVFNNMENSYNFDYDFFARNAVEGTWNEEKYFNMCSGKHRATFLLAKGQKYIPLKVNKNDYQNYVNYIVAKKVTDIMKRNKCFKLFAPIEHPFFMSYPCENAQLFYQLVIEGTAAFSRFLREQSGKMQFKGKSIFISMDDCGFLRRHFQRMGLIIFSSSGYKATELETALNELLYVQVKKFTLNNTQTVDFAIIDLTVNEKTVQNYKNVNYILSIENEGAKDNLLEGGARQLLFNSVKNGNFVSVYLYQREKNE